MVYMIGDELMDSAEYAKKYLGYMKGGNLPGGKYDIKTILENFRKQLKAAEKSRRCRYDDGSHESYQ